MAKRRGRYRSTPARRAALKKAQAASARKRRRQRLAAFGRGAASIGGTIAVGAIVYHGSNVLKSPSKAIAGYKEDVSTVKGLFRRGPKVDPNAPGVALKSNRKPLRYYGQGRAGHISGAHTGRRIRSRV